jgi:PII-like signaling protein
VAREEFQFKILDLRMDLSIVIPIFNEAENVETVLSQVEEALASFEGTYDGS